MTTGQPPCPCSSSDYKLPVQRQQSAQLTAGAQWRLQEGGTDGCRACIWPGALTEVDEPHGTLLRVCMCQRPVLPWVLCTLTGRQAPAGHPVKAQGSQYRRLWSQTSNRR